MFNLVTGEGSQLQRPTSDSFKRLPVGVSMVVVTPPEDAELGNILIVFMLEVLETLGDHPVAASGRAIIIFGEHLRILE